MDWSYSGCAQTTEESTNDSSSFRLARLEEIFWIIHLRGTKYCLGSSSTIPRGAERSQCMPLTAWWHCPQNHQGDTALKTSSVADPVVFLLATKVGSTPEHDWLQTMGEVYSSWLDWRDSLTQKPHWELYTDRSSFVCSGKYMSGYVHLSL